MIRTKYLSLIFAGAIVAAGCQSSANVSTSLNSNSAPAASVSANANANSASIAADASANDPGNYSGSPTEVYKAAYTARKNCDLAGLKKVMAKELLDFMTRMAKDEKKSVDDELKDLCGRQQAATEQVRNEKIDGDHASIEYLDEENNWERMDFVREDGAWKMSLGAPGQDAPDNPVNDKNDDRS